MRTTSVKNLAEVCERSQSFFFIHSALASQLLATNCIIRFITVETVMVIAALVGIFTSSVFSKTQQSSVSIEQATFRLLYCALTTELRRRLGINV